MKKINWIILYPSICIMLSFVACKKDFLDAKPSTDIVNPSTLDDFQGLLEASFTVFSPGLPTLSADEYNFKSFSSYQSTLSLTERNSYIWKKDIFEGEIAGKDWSSPYEGIFLSNNVLDGLEKLYLTEKNVTRLNFLKGWALFNRAFAYYDLISNFSVPYDENTANTDLGVPLKLKPSVDDIQPRATVKQVYNQIVADLTSALPLLADNLEQDYRNHPTKVTVYALLARIYLSMRKYDLAENNADSSLKLYNKLIDYNTLNPLDIEPFIRTNDELIYWKTATNSYSSFSLLSNDFISISPLLLASYEDNDLRKSLYFNTQGDGSTVMKLSYLGFTSLSPFTGLATDELYLIKAECAARRNDIATSLRWLNDLLIKRYRSGNFSNLTAASSLEALDKVLMERRKELIWRNLRWSDLRRLNKEGANITLTRELNGVTYTLPPNDPRYVFPIPDNEIILSGIQQNQR